jgi:membrane protein implicated in regulation of membrane protease activity
VRRMDRCYRADPIRCWLCFGFVLIFLLIPILGFFLNMIVFAFFVTGVAVLLIAWVIFCAHARFKGRERSKEVHDEDR